MSGRGIRVLLMSPLAGRDAPGGDVTYTETLLEHPPPGVEYTDYATAIETGDLIVRGRRPDRGAVTVADALAFGLRAGEHLLRGRVMFREPYWHVTVRPGAFDLVHQHLFTLRQLGPRTPAVSTAGYPLRELYQAQDGWSPGRAARAERLDRSYSRAARAHTPGLWARRPDVLGVYTEHFRAELAASGPPAPVRVCGQGLALPLESAEPGGPRPLRTVGFVGRDFARKGGPIAIAAFEEMRRRRPDLRMTVVTGRDAVAASRLPDGTTLHEDLPRDRVLDEVLPSLDVLLLPTAGDCGAPYGIIEALGLGLPVVTSHVPWLDERLAPPAVRRVPAEPLLVADAALDALDDRGSRDAARALAAAHFSLTALHAQIGALYAAALDGDPA